MKKSFVTLALAGSLLVAKTSAVSLDDIQFWTGAGTNRAALVVEWTTPESMTNSTVPAPIADQSLVWGYRFNGTATATQMLLAILAADPRFYVVDYDGWGATFIVGIGYNLAGGGALGLTDGTATNYFTNNFLTNYTVNIDAAWPLNPNDLYWGGFNGPSWEFWTELGDAGGFLNCPDRGTNAYWTPDDPSNPYSGTHGQWALAQYGLDDLYLTNGSWIGFSVAASEYESDTNAPYNTHKHAPKLPDPTITALVKNLTGNFQGGQWRATFLSVSNWNYSLERSTDLQNWTAVATNVPGTCGDLIIADTNAPPDRAFYRVKAGQP